MRRYSSAWLFMLTVTLVAIGAPSFGYWTQPGGGTDTASATSTTGITVNQTNTVTGLGPGVTAVALSGTFANNNASTVYVGTVTATVTGTNKTGCDATDYTITGSAVVDSKIASGSNVGSWNGISIAFHDKAGVDQNVCKGATVKLAYSSN